ncbi:hypothetical protein N7492_009907 [Penicillium capsulatum]|uniref:Uncharacterized protein n=1 Tax=Penicillium capsulatum TaxID=69766 RepID=A0A9W9LES2_9EURO|nr:hypothetical protein N7492_009907 [Penicillium capsulatum]
MELINPRHACSFAAAQISIVAPPSWRLRNPDRCDAQGHATQQIMPPRPLTSQRRPDIVVGLGISLVQSRLSLDVPGTMRLLYGAP